MHAEAARAHIARSPYADRIEVIEGPASTPWRRSTGPSTSCSSTPTRPVTWPTTKRSCPSSPRAASSPPTTPCGAGRVVDDSDQSDDTRAIRAFNDAVVADARVVCVQLTVRDGVTLIRPAAAPPPARPLSALEADGPDARLPPPSVAPRPARHRPHRSSRWPPTATRAAGGRGPRGRRSPSISSASARPTGCCGGSGTTSPTPPCGRRWRLLGRARPRRSRRLRGVRAGGQGRRPARRARARGRLLPGPDGRRGHRCWPGYPFDVLVGLGPLDRDVALRRHRRRRLDGPVVDARRRRRLGRLRRGHRGAGRHRRLRRAGPPRPGEGGRAPARRPRGVLGPAGRGGRARRAWRPSCPRRAGASRRDEAYPAPGLLARFVGARRAAHDRLGRPPPLRRGRPQRRTWPACSTTLDVRSLRAFRARRPDGRPRRRRRCPGR